jgi:hypothetical protein
VLGGLRNAKFFSLAELNMAIAKIAAEINSTPFQKRDGCRQSVRMIVVDRKSNLSCLTSSGPTWRETMDRLAVNRWPSLREIRSLLPCSYLLIDAVDERPIEIEYKAYVVTRHGSAPGSQR